MNTLKKMWARFLRYLDEINERERRLNDVPSLKEIADDLRAHQAEIREAAKQAGLVL